MCGNREDAEDIVQKTFIQAIIHIKDFKGESSIYTWLYTIAKNLCLKLYKERKRSSFSSIEALIYLVKSSEDSDNLSILEKQYYINQVKEGCLLGLLRCLPFNQRLAFILNVLLEVKVKDAALVIDKSETAVRLLVYRAKQNLKGFLCKNCSIYDKNNPCRCENLINFSIKNGWIEKTTNQNTLSEMYNNIIEIENEISSLKKIIRIYNSLDDNKPLEKRIQAIRKEINKDSYKIFSKKVK